MMRLSVSLEIEADKKYRSKHTYDLNHGSENHSAPEIASLHIISRIKPDWITNACQSVFSKINAFDGSNWLQEEKK